MFGWESLTHVVYAFIVLSLVAAYAFVILLSLRQKKRLQELERDGYRPASVAEGIIRSQHPRVR